MLLRMGWWIRTLVYLTKKRKCLLSSEKGYSVETDGKKELTGQSKFPNSYWTVILVFFFFLTRIRTMNYHRLHKDLGKNDKPYFPKEKKKMSILTT